MNGEFLWGPRRLEVSKWVNMKWSIGKCRQRYLRWVVLSFLCFLLPAFGGEATYGEQGTSHLAGSWAWNQSPSASASSVSPVLARQTPKMSLGKDGGVWAYGGAGGRFWVRTDAEVGWNRIQTKGVGVISSEIREHAQIWESKTKLGGARSELPLRQGAREMIGRLLSDSKAKWYKLNMCLPPEFICWILIPNVMVSRSGAFGKWLGREDGALGNGMSAFL